MQACAQAKMEKNKRFWNHLQHLEDQKHQFALYIKSRDAYFLDSLLQQFNFGEAKEVVASEGTEKETEGEFEEDQQLEKKKC